MTPHSAHHIVTDEEIEKIKSMGYSVTYGTIPITEFLTTNFPGFQLKEFLTSIDNLLSPLTEKRVSRELAYFEKAPQMLMIRFYSEDHNDETYGIALARTFVRKDNEIIAEHDFFKLPIKFRNHGIGKNMLNLSLKQYLHFGVDKITLDAALNDGGLVWAKAFFTAPIKTEVKKILDDAEKRIQPAQFKFVKRINDNYYEQEPDGKAFPMVKWSKLDGMEVILRGSEWKGEIDLKNSELLAKFIHYVA